MKAYTIEVTKDGIKKTFIDGDKTYEEVWVRNDEDDDDYDGMSRTLGASIISQLKQNGDSEEHELIELLDEDDLDGLCAYLKEEDQYTEKKNEKGALIKNVAYCKKCDLDLLSIYTTGLWGFASLRNDDVDGLHVKCPFCNAIHHINEKEIISGIATKIEEI